MAERVYVFDLDDTLYLERDYVRSGFAHIGDVARESYAVDGVGDHAWSLFEQGIRGNTFDLLVTHFSLPAEASRHFIDEYRGHTPKIDLQPDARAFLRDLPDDAIGTGVITDGHAEGQWRKLRALGLDELLDNIVVTGDRGSEWTKPSPHAFRLIESRFNRRGVEFVYFGDNPAKDFNAPRDMGWRTVRVRRPLSLHYAVDDMIPVDETISEFPADSGKVSGAADHQQRTERGRSTW